MLTLDAAQQPDREGRTPSRLIQEPVTETFVEVPEFAEYTDQQLIVYAGELSLFEVKDYNYSIIRQALKIELNNRLCNLMNKGGTTEEMRVALRKNAHNIKCLMEAYVYVVAGNAEEAHFNAPKHIWPQSEIEDQLIEFISLDCENHDYRNVSYNLDFMGLYIERISREH